MQNPQQLRFNVGHTVERIKQESPRPFIQRQGHGVYRKIAPPQILLNAGRRNYRRPAHFLVHLGPRHPDLSPHVPRQHQKQRAHVFIVPGNLRTCPLEIFLQFERISLNCEVQVANREPADNVADGPAGKVESDSRGAGYFLHQIDAFHLIRRQPDFHRVNVISHSSSDNRLQAFQRAVLPCTSQRRPDQKTPCFSTGFPQTAGAQTSPFKTDLYSSH